MMIVLSTQDINMECDPGSSSEGVEDMRKHFGAEVSDLLPSKLKVGHAVGSAGDVNDSSCKSLSVYSFVY